MHDRNSIDASDQFNFGNRYRLKVICSGEHNTTEPSTVAAQLLSLLAIDCPITDEQLVHT